MLIVGMFLIIFTLDSGEAACCRRSSKKPENRRHIFDTKMT